MHSEAHFGLFVIYCCFLLVRVAQQS